jgi:hypothetical protein
MPFPAAEWGSIFPFVHKVLHDMAARLANEAQNATPLSDFRLLLDIISDQNFSCMSNPFKYP